MDRLTRNWVLGAAVVLSSLGAACLYSAAHAEVTYRFDPEHHVTLLPPYGPTNDVFVRRGIFRLLQTVSAHGHIPVIKFAFEGFAQSICGAWVDATDEEGTVSRFIVIGDQVIFMPVDVGREWLTNCGSFVHAQE